MAKYSRGILGPVRGGVGTVVGSSWRGVHYLRSKSDKKKGSSSPAQDEQKLKFGLTMEFISSMSKLLQVTFENGGAATGMNNAMAYTIKYALTGVYPGITINYELVRVSRGSLPMATAPSISRNGTMITFNWTSNAGKGGAKESDKVIIVVHCPELKKTLFTMDTAVRKDGTVTFDANEFDGKEVHTYLAFINDESEPSDSVYTGAMDLRPSGSN
jgi:hypothetical protein